MSIKFSIIIPVYNVESCLSECIESIVQQTYKNMEIILIDDGSTDKSGELCDIFASNYEFIQVLHKKNQGQSCARNLGIQKASGDYLIFVDSDDYISKDALYLLIQECETYQGLDIVLSDGMYEVDKKGNVIKEKHYWRSSDYKGISGEQALKMTLKTAANWSPCGKCYRLSFWRENQFKFIEHRISEDFELIDKVVLAAQNVSMIPAYYYYRIRRQNSTMNSNNSRLIRDTMLTIKEWNAYLNAQTMDKELEREFRRIHAWIFCHDILGGIYFCKKQERKELFDVVRENLLLLQYDGGVETKCAITAIKLIGINATCYLLNIIKRYRIRYKK